MLVLVSEFRIVTFAPLIAAPLESVTVPKMVPRPCWALPAWRRQKSAMNDATVVLTGVSSLNEMRSLVLWNRVA